MAGLTRVQSLATVFSIGLTIGKQIAAADVYRVNSMVYIQAKIPMGPSEHQNRVLGIAFQANLNDVGLDYTA